jgi:hypothetical protein
VFFQARRLDGSRNVFVPHENLVVAMPVHVAGNDPVSIDEALLNAFLLERGKDDWPRFRQALQDFNLASTDSTEIPIEVAIVLMNGALEQVLDADAGKEPDLAAKFAAALSPAEDLDVGSCSRIDSSRYPKAKSVRDVWIRDLFRLRGDFAHGLLSSRYRPNWSAREHLLLASFCFPLLLKLALAERALYTMSVADTDGIDAFEALCCAEHFGDDEDGTAEMPWHKTLAKAGLHRIVAKWLDEESGASNEGP